MSHARARLHSVVFEPELGRSAPLWVWPSAGRYRLALELGDSGRLTIEDSRGLPYADLHKESGSRMRIVLLATAGQSFWVRRGQELAPPVAFSDLLVLRPPLQTLARARNPEAESGSVSGERCARRDRKSTATTRS